MNNILIAVITISLVPALCKKSEAKEANQKAVSIPLQKMEYSKVATLEEPTSENVSVDFDYIIEENGKAFVTYIQSTDELAKNEVIRFIENSTYNFNILPGKVYSMKITLTK